MSTLFPNKVGCFGDDSDCPGCSGSEPCEATPLWGAKYSSAYHKPGCNSQCNTKIVSSDDVSYVGPNLPCVGATTTTSLTVTLQKIDEILCDLLAGGAVPPHNQLLGLQGGVPSMNEYYHLSESQWIGIGEEYLPNVVLWGCKVIWTGEGLTFTITTGAIRFDGENYIIPTSTVTLNDGHVTLNRFDTFWVSPTLSGAIPGTPATNPIQPQINELTQLRLTSVFIDSGAIIPPGVTDEEIYLENNEWTGSFTGTGTVDFEATADPDSGIYYINADDYTNGLRIIMDKGSDIDFSLYDNISLALKTNTNIAGSRNYILVMGMLDSGDNLLAQQTLSLINDTSNWETIAIALESFTFPGSTIGRKVFIEFQSPVTSQFKNLSIDNWRLQGGIDQPEPATKHNSLPGLQGGNEELNEYYHIDKQQWENIDNQYLPDGLLRGGIVSWTGTGFEFDISTAEIRLGGNFSLVINDQITLDPPNADDRFDLFYVTATGFGVKKGTPATEPIVPQVDDPSTQIPLTSILVQTGTTEPGGITTEPVYLDNNEWTGSISGQGTADFDSTERVRTGTKSIKLSGIGTNSGVFMDKGVDFNPTDYDSVNLWLYIDGNNVSRNDRYYIGFANASNGKMAAPIEVVLSGQTNVWQLISLPISSFTFEELAARYVYFELRSSGNPTQVKQIFIDDWKLQEGITQPEPILEHNSLPGLQGGDSNLNEYYHLDKRQYDNLGTQYLPDGLIQGGVVSWAGTGFNFNISRADVRIGGIFHTVFGMGLTLAAPDGVNDRFDLFYVTATSFGVKQGIPDANPVIPQVDDPSTQIPLTSILVQTGTTQPGGITDENVYLENLEWTGTGGGPGTFDFNNLENPRTGTKAIKATGIGNQSAIIMDRGSDFNIQDYDSINLWMYISGNTISRSDRYVIGLMGASGNKLITPVELLFPGLLNEWQLVSIPTSSINTDVVARKIYLELQTQGSPKSVRTIYIDDWILQEGVTQPNPITTFKVQDENGDTQHSTNNLIKFKGVQFDNTNKVVEISGFEKDGLGHRLIGRDPSRYRTIGARAIDGTIVSTGVDNDYGTSTPSSVFFGVENKGSGGDHHVAIGVDNILSGTYNNMAFGAGNTVGGFVSNFAIGANNTVTQGYGTGAIGSFNNVNQNVNGFGVAIGHNNVLTDIATNCMGIALISKSRYTVAVGVANTDYAEVGNNAARPIFVVGIGTTSTPAGAWPATDRKDGFIVRKTGKVEVPELTEALIDADITGRVLVTKEWVAVKKAVITITPAQMLDLVTNPVELIPAPGANKVVKLIKASGYIGFNTTAYNIGATVKIGYDGSAENLAQVDGGDLIDSYNSPQAVTYFNHVMLPEQTYVNPNVINKALVLRTTIDATQGNSPVKVILTYTIDDFN